MKYFEAFSNDKECDKVINHYFVNTIVGSHETVPHEWFFIRCLSKHLMKDPSLAIKFMMFVNQFYHDYKWNFPVIYDYFDTVSEELQIHDLHFTEAYEYHGKVNVNLDQSLIFGNIATMFLIRFLDYTLKDCSRKKIILTSQNDCHKKFAENLADGYALQRFAKFDYHEIPDELRPLFPGIEGFFSVLPVIPTKEMEFPINEIIENGEVGNPVEEVTKGKPREYHKVESYPEYPSLLSSEEWMQRRIETKEHMKRMKLKLYDVK